MVRLFEELLMKFDYQAGARICSREKTERKGTITKVDEDGAWFLWDNDDAEREHWVGDYEHEIMLDTPEAHAHVAEMVKKAQAKIDQASSLLEQAFQAWHQAAAIAWYGEDNGEEFTETYVLRYSQGLDTSKFEAAIEEAGWSTSSLYC